MPATKIQLTSGDKQRAALSVTLTSPLIATVLDGANAPVSGVTVSFQFYTVPQGAAGQKIDGAAGPVDVASDMNGQAPVTLKLGDTIGKYIVRASSTGLTGSPLTFTETAVPANAIVTLDDVREYIQKAPTDLDQDDFIQELINRKSDAIERFIQGPVMAQDFTGEIYDGTGCRELSLRNWPVIGLANDDKDDIQWRQTPASSWLTLEDTKEYILFNRATPWKVRLWRLDFYSGQSNIKVNYRAGYEDVPGDIELACIEEVAVAIKEAKGRLGMESQSKNSGGVGTTDSFDRLTTDHESVLMKYRHRDVV